MALQLPFSIKVLDTKPLDAKYSNNGIPFATVVEANSLLSSGVRHIGLTLNIANVEFWYKDNITDAGLIAKAVDISGKADDNAVVKKTGSQTIAGEKTFSSAIVGNLQGRADTALDATRASLINTTGVSIDSDFQISFQSSGSESFTSTFINNFFTYNPFSKLLKIVNATFTGEVIIPNATLGEHAVNKNQLDLKAPLQAINDASVASVSNVGKTRYYVSGNASFVDMSMQVSASTYAWVNILSNTF